MAKYKRKVGLALEARRKSWDSASADARKGTRRPGSQNRNKGYGVSTGRR